MSTDHCTDADAEGGLALSYGAWRHDAGSKFQLHPIVCNLHEAVAVVLTVDVVVTTVVAGLTECSMKAALALLDNRSAGRSDRARDR